MATPLPETVSSSTVLARLWYNRRLFLALSIFFVVPPSLYISILTSVASVAIYTIVTGLLFTCGVATITYVAYQSCSGRVVTIGSTFKSLRYSFLPLIVATLIALVFATLSAYIFIFALKSVGLVHKFLLYEFIALLALLILPLQVHCALVVAVNEPNWSFEKLWVSSVRVLSLRFNLLPLRSVLLYFVLGLILTFDIYLGDEPVMKSSGWRFVLATLFYTAFIASFVSIYIPAITVLYLFSIDLRSGKDETLFEVNDGLR